ncbi:MAG: hypothetical protein ACMXYF_00690 [Candidatus Woesearchaeota archaeon]
MAKEILPHEYLRPSRPINWRDMELYSPIEVLGALNPEIAGVAYARKEGLMDNGLLPYVAAFRERQTEEKGQILDYMLGRFKIESDERQRGVIAKTAERLEQLRSEGFVKGVEISQAGQNYRSDRFAQSTDFANILHAQTQQATSANDLQARMAEVQASVNLARHHSDNMLAARKLEYELGRETWERRNELELRLSKNKLKAVDLEAQANQRAVFFTETMRALTDTTKSKNELQASLAQADALVRTSEYEYLAKCEEALNLRKIENKRIKSANIIAYLEAKKQIILAQYDLERTALVQSALLGATTVDAAKKMMPEVLKYLHKTQKSKVRIKLTSEHTGDIEFVVNAE